ncbi:MAG: hypothetical protein M1136_10305 [Chloroflexi bacterium]|nr:hypothetical protein [Chloroflexota bacterium]MCL5076022.1 hypothetical protein [Chloroflexota bacterium]
MERARARAAGGGFFLVFAIGEDTTEGATPGVLLLLLGLAVLGVLTAWRWEGIGGMVTVVGAIALGTFVYTVAWRNKILAALIYSLPFLSPGILLLICWWRTRTLTGRLKSAVKQKLSYR